MSGHKAVSAKENPVGGKCCSASSHYWLQHLDRDQDSGRYPQEVALGYLGDQISLHPVKLLCNKPVLESRAGCIWCNLSQPPLARISPVFSARLCEVPLHAHLPLQKEVLVLAAHPSSSRAHLKLPPTPRRSGCGLAVPQGVKELLWEAGVAPAAPAGIALPPAPLSPSLPKCSGTAKLGRKFLISAAFFSWQ